MLVIKNTTFIKSIVEKKDKPNPRLPEFAFAGRSNVGKSSLINSLTNRKNIAKVSKQPGKTRTINYFQINDECYLVDLPGYGFAKVSLQEKQSWGKMIENYIISNPDLKTIFVLIDAYTGPQKNDIQLIDWLFHINAPFQVICTKTDRISRNSILKKTSEFKKLLGLPTNFEFIFYSSKTHFGKEDILNKMTNLI